MLTSGMHGKISDIMEDGVIIETMSGKLKFEIVSTNLLNIDVTTKKFTCNT